MILRLTSSLLLAGPLLILVGLLLAADTGSAVAQTAAQPQVVTTKEVQDCLDAVDRFDKTARQLCDQALQNKSLNDIDRAEALLGRGMAASFAKNHAAALADFDQAISLKNDFASAYLMRGLTYRDLAQDDLAIADFSKSIALRPDEAAGYIDRATIMLKRQDWARALPDLDHVVSLLPQDSGMLFLRGYVEEHLNHAEDAAADYTAARALNPHIDAEMQSQGFIAGQ